jgi:cytochrome P450
MMPQSRVTRACEVPRLSVEELDHDPHGVFRRWRPLTPLIEREGGSYIAIRSGDVERLIVDPRTRQSETERLRSQGINAGPLFEVLDNTMLFSNGSVHRRRRAPLSRAFAFRLIMGIRPRIRALAVGLLKSHQPRGEINFLDDYAALLPARAVSMLLGLPEADIPLFTRWVYTLAPALGFSFLPAELPAMQQAARDLTSYVSDHLAARRAAPRNDFLTDYIAMVEQEGTLSAAETLSQVAAVILAGSDTTRAAMVMQIALLLQHRDQWEAVCADPELIPGAVAEALRYEPPVGSTPRFTLEDIDLEDCAIPAQRVLSLSTLSAMRDPALYADPDRFNIRRADHPSRHPVFGGGPHRCLGEVLARAELEEGLAALASVLPHVQLMGDPPTMTGHAGIRRVSGMRLCWSPGTLRRPGAVR